MARILIEWQRAGQPYGSQELAVSGALDLSEAAPNFGGLGGEAIVTGLSGAAWVAVGAAVTDDTGELVVTGERQVFRIETGQTLACLEALTAPGNPEALNVAVIASGAQLSAEVDLGANVLDRIVTPAAVTGATLTFEVGDSGAYKPLYNEGTLYSVAIGADRSIAVDKALFYGIRKLKLKSSSAEGAERTFALVTLPRR